MKTRSQSSTMKRRTKTRSISKSKSSTMKITNKKRSKSKSKRLRKMKGKKDDYKWKIGDCVAPHGMHMIGQHYIIRIDNGTMWGMEHNSGRYYDDIPKSIEHNGDWKIVDC